MSADESNLPDGWVREEVTAGMRTVTSLWDGPKIGGGFKCDLCDHFFPIDAVDDATCPLCGRGGCIGTIIQGRQEVTMMYPEGWEFDD